MNFHNSSRLLVFNLPREKSCKLKTDNICKRFENWIKFPTIDIFNHSNKFSECLSSNLTVVVVNTFHFCCHLYIKKTQHRLDNRRKCGNLTTEFLLWDLNYQQGMISDPEKRVQLPLKVDTTNIQFIKKWSIFWQNFELFGERNIF